jgi:tetratricopeptide (TPR) repeat protein
MHSRQARRVGLSAVELAERSGDQAALARAYQGLYLAESSLGLESSAFSARRAFELYGTCGDLVNQASMANNLGVEAYYANNWNEALDWYGQATAGYRRLGMVMHAAFIDANVGEVLVNQGRLDEAEPILRDALRVLRSCNSEWVHFVETHLGRLLAVRGDLTEAEGLLSEAGPASETVDVSWACERALHLADYLVRAGRPVDALDVLDDITRFEPDEVAVYRAATDATTASALLALGRNEEAVEAICHGVEEARSRSLTFDLSRLLLIADRIGPPFDVRLGTTQPAEEAYHLLDRLGVVTPVFV